MAHQPAPRMLVIVTMAAMLCFGCANNELINVSGSVLTSGAALSQGKRTPVSEFKTDDFVVSLVDVTWPDTEHDGGRHEVNWNWYHDGQIISHSGSGVGHTMPMLFGHSPWTLKSSRAAATLGTGHFKVETLIDGHVVSSSDFEITS